MSPAEQAVIAAARGWWQATCDYHEALAEATADGLPPGTRGGRHGRILAARASQQRAALAVLAEATARLVAEAPV